MSRERGGARRNARGKGGKGERRRRPSAFGISLLALFFHLPSFSKPSKSRDLRTVRAERIATAFMITSFEKRETAEGEKRASASLASATTAAVFFFSFCFVVAVREGGERARKEKTGTQETQTTLSNTFFLSRPLSKAGRFGKSPQNFT